jgi:Domain of unknown function (DUF397)
MTRWKKSGLSGSESNCVEIAHTLDKLRDSKNPTGPTLAVDLKELINSVKTGHFDR